MATHPPDDRNKRITYQFDEQRQVRGAAGDAGYVILAALLAGLAGSGRWLRLVEATWWPIPVSAGIVGLGILVWRLMVKDQNNIKRITESEYAAPAPTVVTEREDRIFQANPVRPNNQKVRRLNRRYGEALAVAVFEKGMARWSLRELKEKGVIADRNSNEGPRLLTQLQGLGWLENDQVTPAGYSALYEYLPPALRDKHTEPAATTQPPPPAATVNGVAHV